MASFISAVKSIDALFIDKLPAGKPLSVVKAVRVDRMTVFVGANGRLYSDNLAKFCYTPGDYPWQPSLMRALVKLGAITASDMKKHLKQAEEAGKRRSAKHALDYLTEIGKVYGFELTKEQRAALGDAPASEASRVNAGALPRSEAE